MIKTKGGDAFCAKQRDGFATILLIIIVVIAAGIGFWLIRSRSGSQNTTASNHAASNSFKIYRDSELGYTVHYPRDWRSTDISHPLQKGAFSERKIMFAPQSTSLRPFTEMPEDALYLDVSKLTNGSAASAACHTGETAKQTSIGGSPYTDCTVMSDASGLEEHTVRIAREGVQYSFSYADPIRNAAENIIASFSPTEKTSASLNPSALLDLTYGGTVFKGGEATPPCLPGVVKCAQKSISIDKDKVALGDLDQDGTQDAIVPMSSSAGGTGSQMSVAVVLNKNGTPVYADRIELGGDRDIVDLITVSEGIITINMTLHGPKDGGCCPSVPKVLMYKLINGKLIATQ
jgi:hypothetical protein